MRLNLQLLGAGLSLPSGGLVSKTTPFIDNFADYDLVKVSHSGDTTLVDDHTYSFPVGWQTALGHVSGTASSFYDSSDQPIVVTGLFIKQKANDYNLIWSSSKNILAVYDVATQTTAIALRADRFLRRLPFNQPTAFFNGADVSAGTFDDGASSTNPGQWVLDHTGTLVNAGINQPAMQGMRLDGTTWRDTLIDGVTPILPSVSQATRVSGTVLDGSELGPELLTTAQQQMDSGWSLAGESTVSGGKGRVYSSAGAYSALQIGSILSVGKTYKLVFTVDSFATVGGGIALEVTGATAIITPGAKTITFVATQTALSFKRFSSATDAQIDNISVKEVLPALTNVFSPSTTFKKYLRTNPATDMPGYTSEPARTNKCTCRKANPVDTTNLAKTGNASAVLSLFNAFGQLPSEISGICSGQVYRLNNNLGGSESASVYNPTGGTVNTNPHSAFIYMKVTGGGNVTFGWAYDAGNTLGSSSSSSWVKIAGENKTPTSNGQLCITVPLGSIVDFILPQLEEGAFCTSPIAKLQDGTDPLLAITRAGTVLSFPTAGKIRSNNMAFRMIVVPRAGGQNGGSILGMHWDSTNSFRLYVGSTLITLEKKIAGSFVYLDTGTTYEKDVPQEIIAIQSVLGFRFSSRKFSSGSWGGWTDVAMSTVAVSKGNIIVPPLYQLGCFNSVNQFTGNIPLFDTLFIPEGIADPLAWAKAQWGIS